MRTPQQIIKAFLDRRSPLGQDFNRDHAIVASALNTPPQEQPSHVSTPRPAPEATAEKERRSAIYNRATELWDDYSNAMHAEQAPGDYNGAELDEDDDRSLAEVYGMRSSDAIYAELGKHVYENADVFRGSMFEQDGRAYAESRHESKGLEK